MVNFTVAECSPMVGRLAWVMVWQMEILDYLRFLLLAAISHLLICIVIFQMHVASLTTLVNGDYVACESKVIFLCNMLNLCYR